MGGGIAADAKGRQTGCEHCGDSRCPADAGAARKLAAIALPEQDPLKEDSNSNFTEIPVNILSLPLIGNKMVED